MLHWAFRRGISSQAVSYFIECARRDQCARDDIAHLLADVDDPDAVEFVVRERGRTGRLYFGSHLLGIGDGEPENESLSARATQRLRAIWDSSTEGEQVRTLAFSMWLRSTGGQDLDLLRSIDTAIPFYTYSLQHRVKLGDRSGRRRSDRPATISPAVGYMVVACSPHLGRKVAPLRFFCSGGSERIDSN